MAFPFFFREGCRERIERREYYNELPVCGGSSVLSSPIMGATGFRAFFSIRLVQRQDTECCSWHLATYSL